MAAARFSADVLQMFYGPTTQKENRNLPQASAAEPTISEAIQNLLREIIYKEYLTIKMKQRLDMGWDEVNEELLDPPFCEERARIGNVGNVVLAVEMDSVTCVSKMESNTISTDLGLALATTTKSF